MATVKRKMLKTKAKKVRKTDSRPDRHRERCQVGCWNEMNAMDRLSEQFWVNFDKM